PWYSLRINVQADEGDGYHFDLEVKKSMPYRVIFLERQMEVTHSSKIWTQGSINSGYEPKMEQ
ncbi:MAG: hypothetical protein NTY47_05350, partial [Candidatus Omnitrophica bacterium]|nr:hypothetical protein [Candidatus Omnitrophota bacterium]